MTPACPGRIYRSAALDSARRESYHRLTDAVAVDPAAAAPERSRWSNARLRLVLGFVLAAAGLAGGLTYVFTRSSGTFGIEFPGVKFDLEAPTKVEVAATELRSLDPRRYVIDDTLGFAYRRPESPPWSQPTAIHGYKALLASQQLSAADVSPAAVDLYLGSLGRLGTMLRRVESIRVATGRPLTIRTTADSSQLVFDLQRPVDPSRLVFRNAFLVEAYDRTLVRGIDVPLAALFGATAASIGNALGDVDVRKGTIVASASFHYGNVLLDGRRGDVDVYHAYLFAQSPRRFYIVEIVYSPQTRAAEERWQDLQAMLRSFVVR